MILATRHGNREMRTTLSDLGIRPSGVGYASRVTVSAATASGVPAFDAAIRVASTAVASLRMCVWRGYGCERQEVKTTWQSRVLSGTPNTDQSWFEFWELVEASLTARRNAYVWRTEDAGRVVALWALHPDQVMVRLAGGRPVYSVGVGMGFVDPIGVDRAGIVEAPAGAIMHIKGPCSAGTYVAPSPIDVFRTTFGAALARDQWEEGFYRRGVGGGVILSFPPEITEPQAEAAKRMWELSASGVSNSHGTRVISGGATVTPVTITQRDAQFIESNDLSVRDISRITGVPASLIETELSGGMTPEHEQARWFRHHLGPRLKRIEAALGRDAMFAQSGDRPEFDRDDLIAADVATQVDADVKYVQAGIMLVDEVRAERGKPPLPGGAGMVPQITPVGGAPNPNAHQEPAGEAPDPEGQADAATEPPTT